MRTIPRGALRAAASRTVLELGGTVQPIPERGCPAEMSEGAIQMPRDPRKTWQYFAYALIREEDPAKLSGLMQQLYAALAENGQQPTPKPPRSKNAPSK